MTASHSLQSVTEWTIRNIYLLPSVFSSSLLEKKDRSYKKLRLFLMKLCAGNSAVLNISLSEISFHTICMLFDCLDGFPYQDKHSFSAYRENCIINVLLLLSEEFQKYYGQECFSFDPRLIRIDNFIQEHLDFPLQQLLMELSRELHLTPQYINHIMKQNIGIPISKYINRCKIEKSIQLLDSGTGVTETACMLGYYDHSHFHKYFLKYTGITPADYRNRKE